MSLSALRLRDVLRHYSRSGKRRSFRPPARSRRRSFLETLEPRRLLTADVLSNPAWPEDWPETYRSFEQLQLDTSQYDSSRILVQFREDVDAAQLVAASLGGARLGDSLAIGQGMHEVVLPAGVDVSTALEAFLGQDSVVFAEPNYRISLDETNIPDDSYFTSLWGLNNTGQTGGTADADIDAAEAWSITTGSSSTIVAVIDTGVDYNHVDLAANMWTNSGETQGDGIDNDGNGYVDDYYGWDWSNNDNDPMDDHSHGTHVAGTIGAVGDNGLGVVGVNWQVQIMALKVMDASGSGYLSDAAKALDYAVNQGAVVSNHSYSGTSYSSTLYNAIVNARNHDHIVVAAAGNNGTNNDQTLRYPASYDVDNVITVAATDHRDNLASWSNYGVSTVDLAAPGVSIRSTTPNNGYGYKSGTSMATPHVAGAVALVHSAYPDWDYAQLRDAILDNVDPTASVATKTITGGRLNVANVLGTFLSVSLADQVISENGGSTTGTVSRTGDFTYPLYVSVANGDNSEASMPAYIMIPAGERSVDFAISGVDDGNADGTQSVTILATAIGYEASQATLSVTDDDLSLVIAPGSISEGGGVATGTVTRTGDVSGALTLTLSSSDTSEATVPGSVTIAAGSYFATFDITAVDDAEADGTQSVTITAAIDSLSYASDTLSVTDNDLGLTIVADSISENGGSTTATVTRSGDLSSALLVTLTSSDLTEATVPGSVTIPVGISSTDFEILGVDDAEPDGRQLVTISAVAQGFGAVEDLLWVTDDDGGSNFLNFNDFSIDPYGGGQDGVGQITIEDGGVTLHLIGNQWKKIDFVYEVTADTMLEFDFKSGVGGEVHGIGFDTDLGISSDLDVYMLYRHAELGVCRPSTTTTRLASTSTTRSRWGSTTRDRSATCSSPTITM